MRGFALRGCRRKATEPERKEEINKKVKKKNLTQTKIYRVVFKEDRTPLILDKGQDGDDTDDHAAGNEDDDNQATVHLEDLLIYFLCCVPAKYLLLLRGCYKYCNTIGIQTC